jgi:hypothetical protein
VRSFGGVMTARNLAPTGVEFVIEIPVRDAAEGV